MEVTIEQWWSLPAAGRAVVVDQLLEHLPVGFVDARALGRSSGPLPGFVHQATGTLFHVVFGGHGVLGMSERRFQRVSRVQLPRELVDEFALVAPVPTRAEIEGLVPALEVVVPTALVADQPLPFSLLHGFGIDEARLGVRGVSPIAVGQALRGLVSLGWRLPWEREWELCCRAVHDERGDAPPLAATGRLAGTGLDRMGATAELCADSWRETPGDDPTASGHEVLRGDGGGGRFVGWKVSAAWSEAVWPGRHRLATWREPISLRPWVDLRR